MSVLATISRVHRALTGRPERRACSVCDQDVEAFLPLPDYFLHNLRDAGWPYPFERSETCNVAEYSCPRCEASDRDRLYALYLRGSFRELGNHRIRVVDFAPSAPLTACIRRMLRERNGEAEYRTADLFRTDVDDTVDLSDMRSYASDTIDLFLCSHVLEHVVDDRAAFREIHRVLKPGGRAALLVPIVLGIEEIDEDPSLTDPRERWRRFGQDDHVRLYSKKGFATRMREAGFVVHELGARHFGMRTFRKCGITGQSALYVAEKRALSERAPRGGDEC